MSRRSRAGDEPVKTRRRKTAARKRGNAPKVHSRGTPAPNQDTEIARVVRERDQALEQLSEAMEQQTATSGVLRVISSSPGELEPVFQAMLENAVRICQARFGTLYLRDGDDLRAVATHNAPAYVEARKRNLVRPQPDSALGQLLNTLRVAQVPDITAVKSYIEGDPSLVTAVKLGGYRTVVAVRAQCAVAQRECSYWRD